MRPKQIPIINIYQLYTLILLQFWQLGKLLSKEFHSQIHWRFFGCVVEVLDCLVWLYLSFKLIGYKIIVLRIFVVGWVLRLTTRKLKMTAPIFGHLVPLFAMAHFLLWYILRADAPHYFFYSLLIKYWPAWAQKHRADQAADATNKVDATRTGLVAEAELVEPAAAMDPGRRYWVNYRGHQHCVQDIGVDKCPLG